MWSDKFGNAAVPGWMSSLSELERMKLEMNRLTDALFGRTSWQRRSAGVFPAINLTEDTDNFYARAEIPGIAASDIDLQIVGKNLSISGERKIPSEGENVRYHRREREAGKFSRVIALPGDVNPEKINAKITNGVLTVTIAKSETAKPRQIKVQ